MDTTPSITAHLATRLRGLRADQGLTLEGLADRTGVSRSMLSLIERGESSPTAAVLDKLAAGLGVSLASLFAEDKRADASPLSRQASQRIWQDPGSGYVRRSLSPPGFSSSMELAEVLLPAEARVAYDTVAQPRSVSQQIWIIDGEIELTTGERTYRLSTGDCLAMHIDQPIIFHNPNSQTARYLVAIAPDPHRPPPGGSPR